MESLLRVLKGAKVVQAGYYGSSTFSSKPSDIDVLVIAGEGEDTRALRRKLLEAGFDACVISESELRQCDPIFLYGVKSSFKPVIQVRDVLSEVDAEKASSTALVRGVRYCLESIREAKNGSHALARLYAMEAIKHVIWSQLIKAGLPISGNPEILLDVAREALPQSILDGIRRFKEGGNLIYWCLAVTREVSLLERGSIKEALEILERVKAEVKKTRPDDLFAIRMLCQALFLSAYSAVRAYIGRYRGRAPETHSEIFKTLRELSGIDPTARLVHDLYAQAFDELHVDCHYRGIGDLKLLEVWIKRVGELISAAEA